MELLIFRGLLSLKDDTYSERTFSIIFTIFLDIVVEGMNGWQREFFDSHSMFVVLVQN